MELSIIMGNMFSGKTSELIRRLKRLRIIGKNIMVINSAKDTRSPDEVLKTHDNVKFNCFKVLNLFDLENKDEFLKADIIAIDEAQFFHGLKIKAVVLLVCQDVGEKMANVGLHVFPILHIHSVT